MRNLYALPQKKNRVKRPLASLPALLFYLMLFAALLPHKLFAQAPSISYASPQTYSEGTTITPLSPSSTGVAVLAYSGSTTTIGTGFSSPQGVAVDAAGNVYVADKGNNAVKKIPVGGGSTVAIGTGFSQPYGVAADVAGNIYVADFGNGAIKKILAADGTTSTLATGFSGPYAVAVDGPGNIYIADGSTVKEIPFAGGSPTIIANGFTNALGVAVDASGNVYVADAGNSTVKMLPAGGGAAVTLGSGFNIPKGVAVDGSYNVYIGDTGNNAAKGILGSSSGSGKPVALASGFSAPYGVAADGAGNVYVADQANNLVKEIKPVGGYFVGPFLPSGLAFSSSTGIIHSAPNVTSPATNYTITAYNNSGAGTAVLNITVTGPPPPSISYVSPQTYTQGTAIAALTPTTTGVATPGYSSTTTAWGSGFSNPNGVAKDAAGNVYVADYGHNQVKKIPADNSAPVVIGSGVSLPTAVALDAAGNVYVANYNNSSLQEVLAAGGSTVTLASGFSGPYGVALDAAGNIYLADGSTLKEIPAAGGSAVTIGPAFSNAQGVAVDGAGNIYVADAGNSTVKMLPVGGGSPVTLGSGFNGPKGIAVDGAGNVYVGDTNNNAVKEILAGGGAPITIGFGFNGPTGVFVDGAGIVYVADRGNSLVKFVKPAGGYFISPVLPAGLSFSGTTGVISGTPLVTSPATNFTVTGYNQYSESQSALLSITVNAAAPPAISYTNPPAYTQAVAIPALSPTSSGVSVPGYSSAPTAVGLGFSSPNGVATDAAGNVYVGDYGHNQVKKVPAGGGAPIIIASGIAQPYGITLDAAGNVYASSYGSSTVVEILAGGGGTATLDGGFSGPYGVAIDAAGNIYAADGSTLKEIPAAGGAPVIIGSGFSNATGIAVDALGNLYVADAGNSTVSKIPAGGGAAVVLGSGFNAPKGIAVDGAGNVYVGDTNNNAVKEILAGGGAPITIGFGFNKPTGVAIDAAGNVYVADNGNNLVKLIKPVGGYFINPFLPAGLSFSGTTGVISGTPLVTSPATNYTVTAYNSFGYSKSAVVSVTVNAAPVPAISYTNPPAYTQAVAITALAPTSSGVSVPGYSSTTAAGSGFNAPNGVASDIAGNVYVADYGHNQVKKIPAGGGAPIIIASGIAQPYGVTLDAAGNVYASSYGSSTVVEILVGGGGTATLDGGFSGPYGVAIDAAGNIYAADGSTLKEIPAAGGAPVIIRSGFSNAAGIAIDPLGNLYVADAGNSTVSKIPAGGGAAVVLGSGFNAPKGIAVDGAGNVYVGDSGNNAVKEIPAGGGSIITLGFGFNGPTGTAIDGAGNIYVADHNNNLVKEVKPIGGYFINPALPAGLTFSNVTGVISGTPVATSPATSYTVTAYNNFGGHKSAAVSITVNAAPSPTIIYSGPKTYTQGSAITPLAPTSGGVAAAGYAHDAVAVGSGFSQPQGVATDAAGNIYVADFGHNRVKKIPAGGGTPVVIGSGIAGPYGLTLDAAGNVYVSSNGSSSVQKILAADGSTITVAAGFSGPYGIAVDAAGNLFAADGATLKEIPAAGGSPVIIGSGYINATGVAIDGAGNLYVADAGNSTITMIPAGGGAHVTLGSGFNAAKGIAVDGAGNVYVGDTNNNAVKEIPAGGGSPVTVGFGFNSPNGIAVDGAGNIYVADYGNNLVKQIKPAGGYFINPALPGGLIFSNTTGVLSGTPTATIPATNFTITAYNIYGYSKTATLNITVNAAPSPTLSYATPKTYTKGTAIAALVPVSTSVSAPGYSTNPTAVGSGFSGLQGIAVDAAGNVYVADYGHNQVKKVPAGGGAPVAIGTGFSEPFGIATDAAGNVYVGNYGSGSVREILAAGGSTVTLGTGFNGPFGVAVDASGNVYVADGNSVKKIPPGGSPAAIGSGFVNTSGIAVDASGNVYVADYGNSNIVEIPAGGGPQVIIGSGFNAPKGVAIDDAGNLFIGDTGNNAVKEIAAGATTPVKIGFGFNAPDGIAIDAAGNVYVADFGNNLAKVIKPTGGYYISNLLPAGLSFSNTTGIISGTPTVVTTPTNYTITAYNNFGYSNSAVTNIVVGVLGFNAIPSKPYGTADFDPGATSTAGPVNYMSSDQTVATIVSGKIHIIGAGASTITATDGVTTLTQQLTVTPVPLTITGINRSRVYGSANPLLTASYTGFVNGDTQNSLTTKPTITTTATSASHVAMYPITASGAVDANYTITYVAGTLTVTKAPLSITADDKSKVYGAALPVLTATYNGLVNGDTEASLATKPTITTTATMSSPVGPYSITASGAVDGNYNISYTAGTLTVSAAPLTITAVDKSKVYGTANPALTITYTGFVNGEGAGSLTTAPAISTTATMSSSVGPYPITVSGAADANYNITYVGGTLAVSAAALTIKAVNKSKVYGAANPALTLTYTGFVNGDGAGSLTTAPTISTTATMSSAVGPYPITVSGAVDANYNISYVAATLTVSAAPLTITAVNKSKVYGAANPTLTVTYTGFVNGDGAGSLTTAPTIGTTATMSSKAGPYPITASGAVDANYNISYVGGTLTVSAAPLTITAVNKNKVYGAANPTLTVTYTGFVNGDGAGSLTTAPNIVTTATASSAVGPYPITASGAVDANYSISYVGGTLIVSAAALTIKAANKSKVYGTANPALTVTYTGFVNGDGAGSLTTAPTISTTATTASHVAVYPITVSGAVDANYSISYVAGSLTVSKAALSITAVDKSKVYGAAVPVLTASYNGFVNGDSQSSLATKPTITTTGTMSSPVGPYPITASGAVDGNYNISYVAGTLTVTPAPLTITANDQNKIAGTPNPALTANYSGFLNGDGVGSLTTPPTISTTATTGSPAGAYPITVSGAVDANYSITYVAGTLTVIAGSSNANLSNLKINGGAIALNPAFGYNTLSYTATVTNTTTSVKVTPATADANATVKINGTAVTSGTASPAIALNLGDNTITTVVTAQNGTTTKTYTIVVTRPASTDATLAGLKLSAGTLAPTFAAATMGYTAVVPGSTASITVTPTVNDPNATVKVNGAAVTSGTASAAIALNMGANTITTIVTAQDGTTTDTYTITVGRGASNTNLTNLKINGGAIPLSPAFSYTTTAYTASVPNATTSIKITPAASDANATIKVNGATVASGTASAAINLAVGQNIISTVVTAQDGVTTKTYMITVTRAPSANANLADLAISSGTLTPVFATATTSYTASVPNSVSSLTVTPTTADATATVTVNGSVVTSGTASASQPLVAGPNTITTIVTAQDGTTIDTYTITITRAPSVNANLSNLKINGGTIALTPAFNYNTTSYTASVTNATTSIKITPATADATATVKINGTTVASGTASGSIALNIGSNTITTVVTAQDGTTTKTYTIMVSRAATVANPDEPVAAVSQGGGDGIAVRQGVSPNGDGMNDFLMIDGITAYPDNKLTVMNRNGTLVYEAKGYDNSKRIFDGHSSKTGALQLPGTYFYSLEYKVKGVTRHKTGFIVLKY